MCLSNSKQADGCDKIIPSLSTQAFYRLAKASPKAIAILNTVVAPTLSSLPPSLGYLRDTTQADYHPGLACLTRDEITLVSRTVEVHSTEPGNTRVTKAADTDHGLIIRVLQASINSEVLDEWGDMDGLGTSLRLEGGDHAEELSRICASLLEAR